MGNDAVICPNCGRYLRTRPGEGLRALWIVLFVIIGIPGLLAGGCGLLFLPSSGSSWPIPATMAVIGLGLFALFLWLAFRKRR